MKKQIFTFLGLALTLFTFLGNAYADAPVSYPPQGEERVLTSGRMEIAAASYDFESVVSANFELFQTIDTQELSTARLTLTHLPLTEFDIFITEDFRVVDLKIERVEQIGCGSMRYHASLEDNNLPEEFERRFDPNTFHRFNAIIVDHSNRFCEDYRLYNLEISIREGYGWCGTSDSILELKGNSNNYKM